MKRNVPVSDLSRDHVDEILDEWGLTRPDVDVSAQGVVGRVLRLSRYFERDLAETFSDFGIRGGEFDVLATLRRCGGGTGLPASELANRCMLSSAAMTNRLDGLEGRGLVVRESDPVDRRVVRIVLTRAGHTLIDEAFPRHAANQHAMIGALSEDERTVLAGLLRRLSVAYEEREAQTER
ncbi:MAG: MarR family transcriptional regulator [Nocardioides sp.]|jgi:DNA-binding MarR family transcriptional regulator|nr:MarR family transcriptional regulator [Nocardioides sp.]